MVSAWANANDMVMGTIVSIDAMGCQTEIAEAIVDSEADNVLSAKGNKGYLHEEITGE